VKERKFLAGLTAARRVSLRIGQIPVQIAVNNARLETRVRRYFAPFIARAEGNPLRIIGVQGEPLFDRRRLPSVEGLERIPKASYYDCEGVRCIRKNRTGVGHYVAGGKFYAVGDLLRYPMQLLNLVSSAYGQRLRELGYAALHASCVARRGQALVFAGNSGSGKSSTALAAMESGCDFVSNDRTFLRRAGDGSIEVAGVPKWPRVNPGTLLANHRLRRLLAPDKRAEYAKMDPADLWDVEDKHDVPVESVYGQGHLALNARLKTLFLLTWRPSGHGLSVEPAPGDRLPELVTPYLKTDIYDTSDRGLPSPEALAALLRDADVRLVSGRTDIPAFLGTVLPAGRRRAATTV
jgi:HprK-related kinase B